MAMAFGGVKLYFSGQVQIHRARCTFPVSLSVCWEIGPLQFQGGARHSKDVDKPRRGGLTPLAKSPPLYVGGGLTPLALSSPL